MVPIETGLSFSEVVGWGEEEGVEGNDEALPFK